ncbi:hypothetical protein V1264_018502 [Littorina saxatilis]|uniref:Small integral membrane protein 12 n=1 Tax=Littorina saxatilis TaxID=31220 RepID=A0AAN9GCV4_9CAEN
MVWPLIVNAVRVYAPWVTFPFAVVIGFIGYNVEGWVRGDKKSPFKEEGIKDERSNRVLEQNSHTDCTEVDSLKAKTFVPKTMLGRNDK